MMRRRGRSGRPIAREGRLDQLGMVEAMFSQTVASLALLDRDYRFVRANEVFAQRFRLNIEELPGRRFADVMAGGLTVRHLDEVVSTRQPLTLSTSAFSAGRSKVVEASYWNWSLSPILDDAGDLEFLLLMGVDVTEARTAMEMLRTKETVYQSVFDCMNEGVIFRDANGMIVTANPAAERLLGMARDQMRGHDSDAPQWQAVRENGTPFPGEEHPSRVTLSTGEPMTDVVMGVRRPDGRRIWISINSQPVKHPDEASPHAVVTTLHDITERKATEEQLVQLVHELNHRVKNTLAVVQSIAAQTFKISPDPAGFTEAFNARLLALAHSHDVLTRNNWTGAQVRELLAQLISLQPACGVERIRLDGPDVKLTPKAAIALSMALGELATNAVKFGALSAGQGNVTVSWERTTAAGRRRLRMLWCEHGGPVVCAPERRGLGALLIERSLAHELGGSAQMAFSPEGLTCEMEFPLEEGAS
jgi:PAS domain S-box-containing protein